MKKLLLMVCMACFAVATHAQNFQLHHDFGRNLYSEEQGDRQFTTLTLEQFKADRLGSWFWFIDLDLYSKGMGGAYTEISREFNIQPQSSWAAHVEYDGGLLSTDANFGVRFQQAALVGPAFNGHSADFSKTWSVQTLYKQYFKGAGSDAYASFQLTGVWGLTFANGQFTFSGFADLWRGEKANHHGQLVFLTEPQFWYNLPMWQGFSVGGEMEISNNFISNYANDKTFFINPTLAVKYTL